MKTLLKGLTTKVLAHYKSRNVGQIGTKDEIGRWLELLASLDSVRTIVEVGTWNGLGSSLQIAKGVRKSSQSIGFAKQVIGVEVNFQMWKRASKNLRKDIFFKVLHGSLIESSSLDSSDLTELEKNWFAEDLKHLESSPLVLAEIPNAIDLLVLDGGEFSTYSEYQVLKARVSKWLVLDDTNLRKCKRVLNEAVNIDGFSVVFWSNERNGVAVLSRPPLE
jgi:hypothetical protein